MANTKKHSRGRRMNRKNNKRSANKRNSRRSARRQRGGFSQGYNPAATSASFSAPNNGGGGAGWVEGRYGDANQQYNSVFDIGSKTLGNSFTQLPASQIPTSQSLSLIQSAGGRRRKRKSRNSKRGKGRGGFLAPLVPVVNEAIVPFGLLCFTK